MKRKIINVVKKSKLIYSLYYYIGSICINLLKVFIKSDNMLILFISFGGRKFDDSPKAIYDQMIKDDRFKDYKIVWAFNEPNKFNLPKGEKIKTDTFQYYKTALKSRCWITNSTVERGLNFKGKNTFYYNTWHGTPMKKMGEDIPNTNESFKMRSKLTVDIMTSQSKYEADIFSRVFNVEREKFIICGLPRNDVLAMQTPETKQAMMQKVGLPTGKKVILYAPTYREYERDGSLNCVIKPPIDFDKWKKAIGNQYIILLRAHYEVVNSIDIKNNIGFVYDVSQYPELNDLMLASDILISDYSSIFFDYSILDRPMFYFTYDYDEYESKRGLYFDIRKELFGSSQDEDELLDLIYSSNFDKVLAKVSKFRSKYVESYGNATKITLNTILENIK